MNTGIGDAINLAWKFAEVLGGRAPETLLDSYGQSGSPLRGVWSAPRTACSRSRPQRAGLLTSSEPVSRRCSFRPPRNSRRCESGCFGPCPRSRSITAILFSAGTVGQLHGGDRLPWVRVEDIDNYKPLVAATWQAHVYGVASPELMAWCQRVSASARL